MNGRVIYIQKNNGTDFYLFSAQSGEFQGSWMVTLYLVIIIITTEAKIRHYIFQNNIEQINLCISDFEIQVPTINQQVGISR